MKNIRTINEHAQQVANNLAENLLPYVSFIKMRLPPEVHVTIILREDCKGLNRTPMISVGDDPLDALTEALLHKGKYVITEKLMEAKRE